MTGSTRTYRIFMRKNNKGAVNLTWKQLAQNNVAQSEYETHHSIQGAMMQHRRQDINRQNCILAM